MDAKIDGVIFDFDGTLVDTYRLYVETYRQVLTDFLGKDLSAADVTDMQLKAEIRFFLDAPYREDYEHLYQAFINHYGRRHAELCDGPYPGAFAAVDAIQDRGLVTGLVTGKSRAAYDISVDRTGAPQFAVSVCDDDVNLPKPDPEGIIRACQLLQVDPKKILYVGDSQVDFEAAQNAGSYFAGVLWAKDDREQLEFRELCEGSPRTRLVSEPAGLLEFLDAPG
ncbi:MAG: HAD family hydrolase [bacterium]|nr:HAD family hydrolase [bacterium]